MRQSPSIIPGVDQDIYLVEDNFGGKGRCWCETDVEDTDLDTVITDMLDGQFKNPVRVVGFNTAEGWSRDVSEDVARELRQRCADQGTVLRTHLSSLSTGTPDTIPPSNCRYPSASRSGMARRLKTYQTSLGFFDP